MAPLSRSTGLLLWRALGRDRLLEDPCHLSAACPSSSLREGQEGHRIPRITLPLLRPWGWGRDRDREKGEARLQEIDGDQALAWPRCWLVTFQWLPGSGFSCY